jgi:hypothetical protein
MAMRFPTRQAIEAALASDIRAQSREAGKDLLAMFEGEVVHTVFALDELVAAG